MLKPEISLCGEYEPDLPVKGQKASMVYSSGKMLAMK